MGNSIDIRVSITISKATGRRSTIVSDFGLVTDERSVRLHQAVRRAYPVESCLTSMIVSRLSPTLIG